MTTSDTEAHFIQAVVSNPFDSANRIIYADYLEEAGDERAGFLRLQQQFRNTPHDSPEYRELIGVEQRAAYHQTLDRAWYEQMRTYTTLPPMVDVAKLIPELAPTKRSVIRLHPHPVEHEINPLFSKIGGQFLWPEEEPWPKVGGVPLVPVLQLRSWDFPEFEFPGGCDVMQLFWTPQPAEGDYLPSPYVHWRTADENVTGPLATPPDFNEVGEEFGFDPTDWRVADNLPTPCGVYPERVDEYPHFDEIYWILGEDVHSVIKQKVEDLEEFNDDNCNYWAHTSTCPGWTLGGLSGYQDEAGRLYHRLGTFSSWECDAASYTRWQPLEDRWERTRTAYHEFREPTDLTFGRTQDLAVWVCTDGELPSAHCDIYCP